MKTIFLDIDGVLNSGDTDSAADKVYFSEEGAPFDMRYSAVEAPLCQSFGKWFNSIPSDRQIVISSSWRTPFSEASFHILANFLGKATGIDSKYFVGKTPEIQFDRRDKEILAYAKAHNLSLSDIVIFDDMKLIFSNKAMMMRCVFLPCNESLPDEPRPCYGFSEEAGKKATKLLFPRVAPVIQKGIKTVFLDIDGVLNREMEPGRRAVKLMFEDCPDHLYKSVTYLEEKIVKRFSSWIKDTEKEFGRLQFVVSSSWLGFFDSDSQIILFRFLTKHLEIDINQFVGSTPLGSLERRTEQIGKCIAENDLDLADIVIFDDRFSVFRPRSEADTAISRVVRTNGRIGFSSADGEAALRLLRGDLSLPVKSRKNAYRIVQLAGIQAGFKQISPEDVLRIARSQGISRAKVIFLLTFLRNASIGMSGLLDALEDLPASHGD